MTIRNPPTLDGASAIGDAERGVEKGRTAVEALYPEDPSAIGPYRLLGRLGEGGMGRVYLGRSPSGRMVAVKVLHSELAREPHFRRRFRAEFEAARRVTGMWTAPVLGHDIESAVPWVATGFVAGPTLREVVDTLHGPLPENSVWALAYGLASALMAVHRSGLIHRDLKPSNVMVTLEGPKVIDFGIARSVDASVLTRTGGMVGSPGYMPPEQIRGENELTGAVDVFAMGAVLAYAATGKAPFSWDGAQEHTVMYRVLNDPPNLGPEDGRLKGDLRTLVLHCLAKDARDRPGLAGVPGLAEKRAGMEYWLPSGLTARLGQSISGLLEFDDPDRPPSSWGPRPPSAWEPRPAAAASSQPAGRNSEPTQIPGEPLGSEAPTPPSRDTPPLAAVAPPLPSLPPPPVPPHTPPTGPQHPPSARRWSRGRYALAAASGALALAVSSWLIVANVAGGEGNDQAAGSSEDAGTGDGPSERMDTGTGDGASPEADGVDPDAPLADLVPQDVREAGQLTVHAAEADEPVLFNDDETNDLAGFEVDLLEEIGAQLGVPVDFAREGEDGDVAGRAAVREGRDSASHIAVGGFVDNDEESADKGGVDFVNHFVDGYAVMSRDPERYSGDLDELCGLTITLYRDSPTEESVNDDIRDCTRPTDTRPVGSKEEMANEIVEGRADVAVLLYTQADYYAEVVDRRAGLDASFPDSQRSFRGIAIPSGQVELYDAVHGALQALIDDGTYDDLLAQWHIRQATIIN
ncbi:serine/threonine-protein kinase [Streptomyces sp. 6N223]|uniref:serine/threonine-protein kinase n=1 Tax=Streptomyces sp. 6N223 TaxID=3457412 RepID=UPI003FD28028